jgi:hypothetical protein
MTRHGKWDRGGPLVSAGSEADAVAPTCMRTPEAGKAGPAGAAAAARGDNNMWIGVAAACRRAGKSCMHALWGLPKQSGRRGCGADVPSVDRMHPGKYVTCVVSYCMQRERVKRVGGQPTRA